MVTFNDLSRFFSRTSAGKYRLDVSELRTLFARAGDTAEQIRRFRDERLARIVAGEGSFAMSGSALTVLHLVPLRIADPTSRFDLRELHKNRVSLPPLWTGGWDSRYNLDGFVTSSSRGSPASSYIQVFRHGAIEAVESGMLDRVGDTIPAIPSTLLAEQLLENIPKYFEVQRKIGVDLPIVILLTLVGVKGYQLADHRAWQYRSMPIDRDLIAVPEAIIDDWSSDVSLVLRPILDGLWNAAGYAECSLYDESGKWVGG
jgi:hypothetical protein